MATSRAAYPDSLRSEDFREETQSGTRLALILPLVLTIVMISVGQISARLAGVDNSALFLPYLVAAWAFTFISTLIYVFVRVAGLARSLADRPLQSVWNELREKMPLLLLPAIIFPLFLAGFTTAKTAIPFLVGYHWDAFWADTDKLIFGDDAWRLASGLFGAKHSAGLEFVYAKTWAAGLLLYKANVALYAKPRRVGIIYTAMLLTWLFGGWLLAYSMAATGPVFAHIVDPSLADRFAPLRAWLDSTLDASSTTRLTQNYLLNAFQSPIAVKGGGISAMPSMHVAAVSIYVLSARGTRWFWPAVCFWCAIFFGSAYFGWHYWIDGIVAAAIAWACWRVVEFSFREKTADFGGEMTATA